jgi:hypothetical protein
MIRYGKAPFLECSSKGDKRFSAFYARVNGETIEEQYQAAKIFADGSTGHTWRYARGKLAVNGDEVRALYSKLWDQYIVEHVELVGALLTTSGLQDTFGQPGHACQATELWRIRREWSNNLCYGLLSPLTGNPGRHYDWMNIDDLVADMSKPYWDDSVC